MIEQILAGVLTEQQADVVETMLVQLEADIVSMHMADIQNDLLKNEKQWSEDADQLEKTLQSLSKNLARNEADIGQLFLFDGKTLYWYKWYVLFEKISAFFETDTAAMGRLEAPASQGNVAPQDLPPFGEEHKDTIKLNAKQQEAVALLNNSAAGIVNGAPGMGKSTVIKQAVLNSKEKSILICAPTASAVKLLASDLQNIEGLGDRCHFSTIHAALRASPNGTVRANYFNRLPYEWIIIDETSMLDAQLMHFVILAMSDTARLSLVGDGNQLGAIGTGNFFSRLVASATTQKIDICTLDQHIRLKPELVSITDSMLQEVNSQTAVEFENSQFIQKLLVSESVHWQRVEDWQDTEQLALDILGKWSEISTRQIDDFWDLERHELPLIISSRRTGNLGCTRINRSLYQLKETYSQSLHEGDTSGNQQIRHHLLPNTPLVIDANDKFQGLTNSQFGFINEHGNAVIDKRTFALSSLPAYSLGWVITVHKSQGKENNLVIVIIDESQPSLINKNLIYTALTRSKDQIVIFAKEQALIHLLSADKKLN